MPQRSFHLTTLGCRVNHAETRELESVLRSRGLVSAVGPETADLHVIHTCSVTQTAAAKSRQAVRRAVRAAAGRQPRILVTGCYATTDETEAAAVAGHHGEAVPHSTSDGSSMIERFSASLDRWLEQPAAPPTRAAESGRIVPLPVVPPREPASHIRAELKIQDGCDAHCTFCIIPRIRRTLRSKTVADAVDEARRLVDLGHREIVLSGVFIGAYGHETALRRKQYSRTHHPLADLLDAVAQVPGLQRLRISSMEPGDVDDRLLDAMVANAPVVVPHLHLPLQSGSDAVLRRMNRQYRVGDYLDMIALVEQALTSADGLPPAITTDIICGFPGETDADFEQTMAIAHRVGYLHMHVFPFSPRAGTAAARWRSAFVPERVRKHRVRTLINLETDPDDGLSIRYRRRLLGRTVRVILEQPARAAPGHMTGRCDHYAEIAVPTREPRGSVVSGVVSAVTPDHTLAELRGGDLPLPLLPEGRN